MNRSNIKFIIAGLFISLFIATFLSPYASSSPDGLEKVAEEHGFLENAEAKGVTLWESSPIPDYELPFVKSNFLKTGLAGFIGTAIMFIVGFAFAKAMSKKKVTFKKGDQV